MKKRFIICVNGSTKHQEKKFIEFIKSQGLGWWHWLANTWLIYDSNGNTSAALLRDRAVDIFEEEHILVVEIGKETDTWAGFGPNTEKRNMFKWINDNWNKE